MGLLKDPHNTRKVPEGHNIIRSFDSWFATELLLYWNILQSEAN